MDGTDSGLSSGLSIVSDGTVEGSHVYLDGQEVHDVTSVNWHFSPRQRKTTITLEIANVGIESITSVSDRDRVNIARAARKAE